MTAFYFLILARIILDFLDWFQPKPIWDVLYIFFFMIVGILLLIGHKPELPPSSDGWFFIAFGVGWGLFVYLRSAGLVGKSRKGVPQKDNQEQ